MMSEPEPEPEMPSLLAAAAAAATSSQRRPRGIELCPRLEAVLHGQIEQISDVRANHDLHQWWNWQPQSEGCAAAEPPAGDWVPIGPELAMEVVVADLHDRVIHSCQEWFTSLRLPRPCLVQGPMQEALLRSLRGNEDDEDEEDVECFVVFGAYGNGQVESALQKQLMDAFPEQMLNLQAQAMGDTSLALSGGGNSSFKFGHSSSEERTRINMANQGKVWVAAPTSDPVRLVACAAYPRCQHPSEEVHVSRMFRAALDVITEITTASAGSHWPGGGAAASMQSVMPQSAAGGRAGGDGGGGGASLATTYDKKQGQAPTRRRKIRVVTHALGSFLGHNEPELFGCGLANGFSEFLAGRRRA
jgi:hypothetical protein